MSLNFITAVLQHATGIYNAEKHAVAASRIKDKLEIDGHVAIGETIGGRLSDTNLFRVLTEINNEFPSDFNLAVEIVAPNKNGLTEGRANHGQTELQHALNIEIPPPDQQNQQNQIQPRRNVTVTLLNRDGKYFPVTDRGNLVSTSRHPEERRAARGNVIAKQTARFKNVWCLGRTEVRAMNDHVLEIQYLAATKRVGPKSFRENLVIREYEKRNSKGAINESFGKWPILRGLIAKKSLKIDEKAVNEQIKYFGLKELQLETSNKTNFKNQNNKWTRRINTEALRRLQTEPIEEVRPIPFPIASSCDQDNLYRGLKDLAASLSRKPNFMLAITDILKRVEACFELGNRQGIASARDALREVEEEIIEDDLMLYNAQTFLDLHTKMSLIERPTPNQIAPNDKLMKEYVGQLITNFFIDNPASANNKRCLNNYNAFELEYEEEEQIKLENRILDEARKIIDDPTKRIPFGTMKGQINAFITLEDPGPGRPPVPRTREKEQQINHANYVRKLYQYYEETAKYIDKFKEFKPAEQLSDDEVRISNGSATRMRDLRISMIREFLNDFKRPLAPARPTDYMRAGRAQGAAAPAAPAAPAGPAAAGPAAAAQEARERAGVPPIPAQRDRLVSRIFGRFTRWRIRNP